MNVDVKGIFTYFIFVFDRALIEYNCKDFVIFLFSCNYSVEDSIKRFQVEKIIFEDIMKGIIMLMWLFANFIDESFSLKKKTVIAYVKPLAITDKGRKGNLTLFIIDEWLKCNDCI